MTLDPRHHCTEPQALGRLLELDASDPRRIEAEHCPRCRARLLVFREFLADDSVPPGADPNDASPRLQGAFDAELRARRRRQTGRSSAPRWISWLARVPGPAWAAAVVLVAGGLYAGWELGHPQEDVLRGGVSDAVTAVLAHPPSMGSGRTVALSWSPVPDADGYAVVLVGSDLSDLARFGPMADTLFVLRADRLPASIASGTVAGWQVEATRSGRVIARSPLSSIRIP